VTIDDSLAIEDPVTIDADGLVRQITEIVTAELGGPADALAPETDLRGLAGVDSVRLLRVVAKVERTWDIELDDADVFGVSSIADLSTVVGQTLRARAA
jgi:acyl carrier protein